MTKKLLRDRVKSLCPYAPGTAASREWLQKANYNIETVTDLKSIIREMEYNLKYKVKQLQKEIEDGYTLMRKTCLHILTSRDSDPAGGPSSRECDLCGVAVP